MGTALRDGYRDKAFLMTKIDGRSAVPGHPFLDGKWAPGQNALTVAVGKKMSKMEMQDGKPCGSREGRWKGRCEVDDEVPTSGGLVT